MVELPQAKPFTWILAGGSLHKPKLAMSKELPDFAILVSKKRFETLQFVHYIKGACRVRGPEGINRDMLTQLWLFAKAFQLSGFWFAVSCMIGTKQLGTTWWSKEFEEHAESYHQYQNTPFLAWHDLIIQIFFTEGFCCNLGRLKTYWWRKKTANTPESALIRLIYSRNRKWHRCPTASSTHGTLPLSPWKAKDIPNSSKSDVNTGQQGPAEWTLRWSSQITSQSSAG